MDLRAGLKRQLRSVIEWEDDDGSQLLQQWTSNGDEIKNASKLILKPGQGCFFVYRGTVKAMHHKEGIYNLETDNIPFITTLSRIMQFFESEHKVGIYFFRRADNLNQKWGTSSPIKYEDPVYKFPVGLKAYGNFSYMLANPRLFFQNIVGARDSVSVTEFREVIFARFVHTLSDFLAESQYTYTTIDSSRQEISDGIKSRLDLVMGKLGLRLTDFRIEGTDFDDDTQQRINRIANVQADTIAAETAGMSYKELQNVEALRDAAANEGGAAGAGVGIGAGIGLGQQLSESMSQSNSPTANTDKDDSGDIVSALTKLKELRELDIISEQEYSDKKKEILARL